ncbi:hypothetical protein LTR91_012026 [Friedmanniomyces endolithicus]|uniref:N-acetyltransferase domain-containing protein n=1 Tax=Friedmanniomyces endolithicus TaxID=329885 RepID=A0AAN6KG71_9PEZI|nr:hypothetical protein LTR03_006832 [Friedmanniomyces endolithicus]KAK0913927.1 hypothetical protein LTR57_014226 [Friedmanniomyces endolithicus]KAK0981169.1 hypothetical protein LTR91_012026 [Friedmanniomyces endolithicus]
MLQSSLATWLKKPSIAPQRSTVEGHEQKMPQALPTPPSSSEEKEKPGEIIEVLPVTRQSCKQTRSLRPSRPTLPPNVHFRGCTKEDVPAFKRLNSLLLPIPYPESFYPTHSSAPDEKPMLYLSTLVLLSPYRTHGIAAEMLRLLIVRAIGQYGVGSVGAHVWEANTEGLEWYAKRGFRVVGREDGYYRRLKPSGVVVVRREVGVGDLLGG